jgi:hypothetical protein
MTKPRNIARHLFGSILALAGLISGAMLLPRPPIAAPAVYGHEPSAAFETAARRTDLLQFTTGGHVLGFAADGVCVASGSHALRVKFVNARATNPVSDAAPGDAAQSKAPSNTQRAARLSQVTYPNLWDGVTLTYDAPSGAIVRSTYRIDPYANVDNIRLRYNAPLSVQGDGSLRISFQTDAINESAPQAWQEREGNHEPVQIAFAPCGKDEIRFEVGEYNRGEPLFIDPTLTFDPTLTWNTFLGGNNSDTFGSALAVDGSGNVYVAGTCSFATWGSPVHAFSGGDDAFAAKLDSSGNLIWSTFLGSGGEDHGEAVAVDGSGHVYVAGISRASWGSPVRAHSGGYNAFAAKLDSSGNLIWNTFLSGGGDAVAVDGSGNVYVAGSSVAKLDSNGNPIWNTFLGGGSGSAVAVDGSGNVYVGGYSSATWGSPVRAYSGGDDAFAAKLDSSGNLTWNTFLGSSKDDADQNGLGLAVDWSGNVYVAGGSGATWGSPVRAFRGGQDQAFAAKLDSSGNLTWNTFLGGSEITNLGLDDSGGRGPVLAVDGSGNVYVAGTSFATWGSPVRTFSGFSDPFAARLDSSGNLTWNSFLVGESGSAVAVDGSGNVYVAGTSGIGIFVSDAFVAKLSDPTPTPGGNHPPVINSLSGELSGDTLTLTIAATDTDGDLAQAQVSLLNESNSVVTQLEPIALGNDPSPARPLTLIINGMAQFPSALKTSVALLDSRSNRSGASTFDFSRGDSGGPDLRSSSFDGVGSMTIKGGPFGGALQLEINGVVVAPPLGIKIKGGGAKLKIGGSRSDLNLRTGANRVRLLSDGLRSNIFVLTI